ncbi:hypothetical protein ACFYP6_37585 [Streptomyces goshikiensis]|uniref:hypothetical protein n=1 Tax=Streptomyces goshikiensis TaxID=1942 RepID=UPI0036BF6680
MTLSADLLTVLTADGSSKPVTTSRPGQVVRAEFTASGTTMPGAGITSGNSAKSPELRLIGPQGGAEAMSG